MSPTHGTSSTSYVSILEKLQICTLHFMLNKVLVSITYLHFSTLWFNPHLWSSSSMLLHNELQYEITITTPTTFLQISNVFAERVSPNRRTRFLQIAEHVFSKSPNIFHHVFLQIAEDKSPRYFADQHAAYVLICSLWERPSL